MNLYCHALITRRYFLSEPFAGYDYARRTVITRFLKIFRFRFSGRRKNLGFHGSWASANHKAFVLVETCCSHKGVSPNCGQSQTMLLQGKCDVFWWVFGFPNFHKPSYGLSVLYWKMLAPNPTFAHTQRTHPNNIVYLSSEEKWKHRLYAGILTVVLRDLGFKLGV